MTTISLNTECFEIREAEALDPISVYFTDYQIGRGMVTLVCYGNAFSSYFGAMGGNTIKEFFCQAGTDYLVNKLGISQVLRTRKRDQDYLRKIIDTVKKQLAGGQ